MTEVPGIAREIIDLIERFECTAALARLDEPREGGALPPAIAGILRARALGGVEKFYAAHLVLRDLRAMRDLSAVERIEVQLRSARRQIPLTVS